MAGAVIFGLISLISLTIVVILQQRRINATSATVNSNTNDNSVLGPIPTTEAPFPSPVVTTAGADLDAPLPAPVVRRTRAPTTENPTRVPVGESITTMAPTQDDPVVVTPAPPESEPTLLDDCLVATGVPILVRPSDGARYTAAKTCLVFPPTDYNAQPLFIVQPTSPAQVAAVVQCATTIDDSITVSARSGAHSYVAGSCRGEIVLDLQQLGGVNVDSDTNEVTWGAGLVHGQLYGPLWEDHRLLVAGGTENMVGTGGLWLGCGRGLLTQAYGYSCDHLLAIEYVDAQGQLQRVEKDDDDDMGRGFLFRPTSRQSIMTLSSILWGRP